MRDGLHKYRRILIEQRPLFMLDGLTWFAILCCLVVAAVCYEATR